MHELSVCLSLLQQVEAIAAERHAAAVIRIELEVGPLSGVEPDLLRNAWPLAAAGTIAEPADDEVAYYQDYTATYAEPAELSINSCDLVVECSECGEQTAAKANRLLCASCGDYRTRVVSGEDLTLLRLELETTPKAAASL